MLIIRKTTSGGSIYSDFVKTVKSVSFWKKDGGLDFQFKYNSFNEVMSGYETIDIRIMAQDQIKDINLLDLIIVLAEGITTDIFSDHLNRGFFVTLDVAKLEKNFKEEVENLKCYITDCYDEIIADAKSKEMITPEEVMEFLTKDLTGFKDAYKDASVSTHVQSN